MRKKAIIILSVICALIVAFIWGNSILSPEISDKIGRAAGSILSGFLGQGDETVTVGGLSVRKVGHFCEFFALGIAAWLFWRFLAVDKAWRIVLTSLVGIAIPFLDETIQIFSGRGHSIKDVWIDIGGFSAGVLVTVFAIWVVSAIVKRVKTNNK